MGKKMQEKPISADVRIRLEKRSTVHEFGYVASPSSASLLRVLLLSIWFRAPPSAHGWIIRPAIRQACPGVNGPFWFAGL